MSHKKLEVRQLAPRLVLYIHKMTFLKLLSFEMYEERKQIRNSIKTVKSTIAEGYGRRRYKQEF